MMRALWSELDDRPFARSKAEAIRTLTSLGAFICSFASLVILIVVHFF